MSALIGLVILAGAGLRGAAAQSTVVPVTSTAAGPSMLTAANPLKLARTYSANNFFDGFNFETADDPAGGYVNYVDRSTAQSGGLVSVQSNGAVIMRANSENRASGRGRDSVRISSKDEWADGVYILDVNHMPVGCGVWPAWWTVVKNGWPAGGEIDIVEGANALPTRYSTAWNATANTTTPLDYKINRNVASLHTDSNCALSGSSYMTGSLGSNTCSAYVNGNAGCGVVMGGNTTYGVESFGSQVNDVGGGWYAMWRDISNSGGVYVWFWPRNSRSVPDDVRYSNASTTSVQNWGQPGANLTVPGCKNDFGNHVIVFNIDFCGDYAAATYAQSGCPAAQTCASFVMNNPTAFVESYWSINSLRVYTASGSAITYPLLTTPQIIGIAVGGGVFLILCAVLFWRWRVSRRRRLALALNSELDTPTEEMTKPYAGAWAATHSEPELSTPGAAAQDLGQGQNLNIATKKPRTGRTTLAPGKTARHHLDGETQAGFYHSTYEVTPNASTAALNDTRRSFAAGSPTASNRNSLIASGNRLSMAGGSRLSLAGGNLSPIDTRRPSMTPSFPSASTQRSSISPSAPLSPSWGASYTRPESGFMNSHSFVPERTALGRRESTFAGDKNVKSWVG